MSTLWAIDDFTVQNGSTEVVPGSHLWDDEQLEHANLFDPVAAPGPEVTDQLIPVEMAAGSCAVFSGTLLHRGEPNRSAESRSAMSHQDCEPWARHPENYFLSIPSKRVARMPERLQALLGYSIHPPFIGQMAGRHPSKALLPDYRSSLEIDDVSRREPSAGNSEKSRHITGWPVQSLASPFSKIPAVTRPQRETAEIGTHCASNCRFLPTYATSPLENYSQTV